MAQPTSVILTVDDGGDDFKKKSEYGKVLTEHKRLKSIMSKTAKSVFTLSSVTAKEAGKTITPKHKKRKTNETTEVGGEEGKQTSNSQPNPLPPIPTFFPLLHSETAEACMMLCLQLLGLKSKKGTIDKAYQEKVCPPPKIVNAVLVLLLSLLRSRLLAAQCLQMGGADLLLALPSRSSFNGKTAVLTVILRRMLEVPDDTLCNLMVTEIRECHFSLGRGSSLPLPLTPTLFLSFCRHGGSSFLVNSFRDHIA